MGLLWFFGFDQVKNGCSIDGISASNDNGVTDFSNQYNESSRGIVVL
jgi:hypothetical protein